MANLVETSTFPAGITRVEVNEPLQGGEDGVTNRFAKQLGNRTRWLKDQLDALVATVAGKATYADLAAHRTSGDHDARYLRLSGGEVAGTVTATRLRTGINGVETAPVYADADGQSGVFFGADGRVLVAVNGATALIVEPPGEPASGQPTAAITREKAGLLFAALSGATFSGGVTFQAGASWAADPATANQLTRKSYVDAQVATRMTPAQASATYLALAANLADLPSPAAAREALQLGSASIKSVGSEPLNLPSIDIADARYLRAASNLTDLPSPAAARAALELGSASIKSVGAEPLNLPSIDIADARYAPLAHAGAGGAAHAAATTAAAGFMSAADKVKLNGVAPGANVWPGVFAGTARDGTSFPVGACIVVAGSPPDRRAYAAPRVAAGNVYGYEFGGAGAALPGLWKSSGAFIVGANVTLMVKESD